MFTSLSSRRKRIIMYNRKLDAIGARNMRVDENPNELCSDVNRKQGIHLPRDRIYEIELYVCIVIIISLQTCCYCSIVLYFPTKKVYQKVIFSKIFPKQTNDEILIFEKKKKKVWNKKGQTTRRSDRHPSNYSIF